MKKYISLLLAMLLAFALASCGGEDGKTTTDETSEEATGDTYDYMVMPVYSVENSGGIFTWETLPSDMTAVQTAQRFIPEEIQSQYYSLRDVTPQQFWLRTKMQIFIYGKEADETALNGVYVFIVKDGSFFCSVTPPEESNVTDYSVSAIYAADFNRDGTYEIYLNALTSGGAAIAIGADLSDGTTALAMDSGKYDYYMYIYHSILYLVKNPYGGTDIQKIDSMRPVIENGKIADKGTATSVERILVAQSWFNQNTGAEDTSEDGDD